MIEELLINVNEFETRVALIGNNMLQELHLQREAGSSVTGNIYIGRVQRVLPGIQAAFVEVGLDRPGFLHVNDVVEKSTSGNGDKPTIQGLLHDGQSVMVQVSKDPISDKGARLTTRLAIASRYLVLMPNTKHIGVSQKISDQETRERLHSSVQSLKDQLAIPESAGFIVRTVAESETQDVLELDMRLLSRIWDQIGNSSSSAPALIYEELPRHIRVIRDLAYQHTNSIKIDDVDTFNRVKTFVERHIPEYVDRLELYEGSAPIFDRYNIEEEYAKSLRKRIALRSGGSVIIEQTEAMVTIDVNTGGFVGSKSLEDTVFRTNLEAAQEIPRQLRLRNLGGIIVIDFIDMDEEEHQRQVLRELEKALQNDPVRVRTSGFSSLGLVELSRKRDRESLLRQIGTNCETCGGAGYVKSSRTVCYEIFRALKESAGHAVATDEPAQYVVRTAQEVVDALLDQESAHLKSLCTLLSIEVQIQLEATYDAEQFDVISN